MTCTSINTSVSSTSKAVALKERTRRFTVRVVKSCRALPGSAISAVVTGQLLRSATSVAANYRAVCRSRSRREFIAKMGTVVEEADETLFWLELLVDVGLLPERRLSPLKKEADELLSIFVAARRTAERHLSKP